MPPRRRNGGGRGGSGGPQTGGTRPPLPDNPAIDPSTWERTADGYTNNQLTPFAGTYVVPNAGATPPPGSTPPPDGDGYYNYVWTPYYGWTPTRTTVNPGPTLPGGAVPGYGPNGGAPGGSGAGSGGSGGLNLSGMNGAQRGAFDAMYQLLDQFGLSDLAPMLRDLILGGVTDSASLQLELQQTDTWKRRFAGNEMLRQQGLGVLSPGEYLATERSYAQIMRNYGLPAGFYDEPADFAKWIGNSVSAAELQQRVSMYADLANREDPAIVAQLQSMGLNKGDLLAYMIDPTRAAPLVQRQYQTTLLGGAARRAGMAGSDLSNAYLGQLADQGISEQQASQGYGTIAGSLKDARSLSAIYGQDYGLQDMQAEVFQNDGNASRKRKRLASQERASFGGAAGVGRLGRDGSGSY